MKVVVTGASGFLGRHLLERLDDHEVVAVSRSERSDPRFVVADVTDEAAMTEVLQGADVLVHAAGLVSHDPVDSRKLLTAHLTGTEATLAAAKAAGVARVVYLSTSGVMAVSTEPKVHTERSARPTHLLGTWPYYRTKWFAEEAALKAAKNGLNIVLLNPSLLLGPGDVDGSSTGAVSQFMEDMVAASPPGGLNFCDVRDVADAVVAAFTKGESGQRYLLGAANMSFREFYGVLARITDTPQPPLRAPKALRSVLSWLPAIGQNGFASGYSTTRYDLELACHYWYLDADRAEQELGWNPRDPLATLADTVSDIEWRLVQG